MRNSARIDAYTAHADWWKGVRALAERGNFFVRGLSRVVVVKPVELPLLLAAFGTVFCMFTAYMMLRPVRDAIGAGDFDKIAELFWGTFAAMLVVQPVYGWLTSRFRRTAFLPWVYGFFCLNLVAFWAWLSYSAEGSASHIAAGLLALSLVAMMVLLGLHRRAPVVDGESMSAAVAKDRDAALGGGMWSGFVAVATSRYLLGVALFVLLLTWVSTFLYVEQLKLVNSAFANRDERVAYFSTIDFWVQAASLVLQMLIFSRLFKRFGFGVLLVSMPLLMMVGFAAVAMSPTFAMVVGVMIARRVGEYGVTRPCRDMLWTNVPREQKYKAKAIIDTFVYRGGDATSASLHAALNLGVAGTAWLGVATAGVWAGVAWWLGRRAKAERV